MPAKAKKLDTIVKSLTVLEAAELARMLEKKWGVPAGAAKREPESQREMAEIIHRISSWAGGEKAARLWYRSEALPAFGGRTAEALVNEGRAAEVRDFL